MTLCALIFVYLNIRGKGVGGGGGGREGGSRLTIYSFTLILLRFKSICIAFFRIPQLIIFTWINVTFFNTGKQNALASAKYN